MSRGSHFSSICLAESQVHGGKDWLVVLNGARPRAGFTHMRSLKQMFVSHHASVGHSLLVFLLLWRTPNICIKISVNFFMRILLLRPKGTPRNLFLVSGKKGISNEGTLSKP